MAGVTALTLTSVRVRRGNRTVLDVAQLDARAGEVVAIIGPNGAGKSTLLRVAALLESPDAGEVVHGQHGDAVVVDSHGADRERDHHAGSTWIEPR